MQIKPKFSANLQTKTIMDYQQQQATQNTIMKESVGLKGEGVGESGVFKDSNHEQREQMEEKANALFESLNTGLALRFHERSGEWYAVVENKLTKEVIKEVPPKYILDLQAKLKEMVGIFLDKKI